MNSIRFGLFALVLIGLALSDGTAQDAKKDKKKTAPPPLTAENLSAPLFSADIIGKLKLTAEQKPMADKLMNEFAAKNKALVAKLPATAIPAPKTKAKNKTPGATSAELLAVLMLRTDYEKKFEEILSEPQKKVFDELLAQRAAALLTGGK